MRSLNVRRNLRGLTLIELVFVVAILAILAGFLLPRLGIVRNLALAAGEADQTREALNQVVLYNIEQGKYPQGLDTLLESTGGAAYGTTSTSIGHLDAALTPLLVPLTLTGKDLISLNSQLTFDSTGVTAAKLFSHDITVKDPNASGSILTDAATSKVAQVKVPTTLTDKSYPIYQSAYGTSNLDPVTGAPLDGTYLVAFGFGPNSELIGKTTVEAPIIATRDPLDYQRPIVLLKIYGAATIGKVSPGTAAATAGAISPTGKSVGGALTGYAAQKDR